MEGFKPIIIADADDDAAVTKIAVQGKADAPGSNGAASKADGAPAGKSDDSAAPKDGAHASKSGATHDNDDNARNAAFAAMRVENTKLNKTVEELSGKLNNITQVLSRIGQPPGAVDETGDPMAAALDKLAKDPINTIKEIAKGAYQEVGAEERFHRTLFDARKAVVDKYPALRDQNSYEYQVFNEICANNPEYFKLAKGPLYAMRDMEERLAAEGRSSKAGSDKGTDMLEDIPKNPPVIPSVNNGVGMRPGSGFNATKGAQELTPTQLEYCQRNGIDPKVYKQVISANSKGGFSV